MSWQQVHKGWLQYLRIHWPSFLFIILLYLIGVIFGSLGVKALSSQQAGDLVNYFDLFLSKLKTLPLTGADAGAIVFGQLKVIAAVYLLGLTVIGLPLVLILIFTRGFILGFTVGFLVQEKALKGIAFAVLSVLPQNLLAIPALIFAGVAVISFAGAVVKRRANNRTGTIAQKFLAYTAVMLFLAVITAGAGLMEAYVTPVFMKLAAAYIY